MEAYVLLKRSFTSNYVPSCHRSLEYTEEYLARQSENDKVMLFTLYLKNLG